MLLTLKAFHEIKAQKEILEFENKKHIQWSARQSGIIKDLEDENESLKDKLQIADQALRFINSREPNPFIREALKQISVYK